LYSPKVISVIGWTTPKAILEAPTKEARIARRHDDARSCKGFRKGFRRGYQCLEVQVSFSNGVPEKGQYRGVSGYPFMALDDHCGPTLHGIRQLARAIVSMNLGFRQQVDKKQR
jgi:hypothetical protein